MTIYKNFRNVDKTKTLEDINLSRNSFSNYYDQPTYLSFKLKFESPDYSNQVSNAINYDIMPHPLFNKYKTDGAGMRQDFYSTIAYLESINEFGRAKMLEQFIDQFNDLQDNFSWYFQKVEGVEALLKIDPKKGMRILEDKRITITCLEALDLRMSLLLSLYRKIVWDDVYQRWILPDMMRYFQLKIYISEFRTFHIPSTKNIIQGGVLSNNTTTYLEILNNIIPVWVITCTGCQFDIEETEYDHFSGLTVSDIPPMGAVKFKIKMLNIAEAQTYPMYNRLVINDYALNGIDRAQENVDVLSENYNMSYKHDGTIQVAQNYPKASSDTWHQTGKSFNQSLEIQQSNKYFQKLDEEATPSYQQETWASRFVDNTFEYAKSSAKSFIKQQIDKLTMAPIPALGNLSFNEAISALQSADILTMYSLIKRSINVAANEFTAPSSRLGNEISDTTFRGYLRNVVELSEATNDDSNLLNQTAKELLNDQALYSQFSDMVNNRFSSIEINSIDNLFKGTSMTSNSLKDFVQELTKGDLSSATIDKGDSPKEWASDTIQFLVNKPENTIFQGGNIIGEGIPTSAATTNKILKT